MPEIVCPGCHQVKTREELVRGTYRCKICERARHSYSKNFMDPGQRREDITQAKYELRRTYDEHLEEWQSKLKAIDDKVKILNEAEWRRATMYFNGCALCGEPEIEVRYQLLTPELGGRYTVLNTIPVCGDCVKVPRRHVNPFEWLAKSVNVTRTCEIKILQYLEETYAKFKS